MTLNCSPSALVSSVATKKHPRKRAFLCGVGYRWSKCRSKCRAKTDEVEHRKGLKWLVHGNSFGDSLVFYFSGHGLQSDDEDGDEVDGSNEAICPLDDDDKGVILDNQINSMIVKPLRKSVTLHAIMDCCHSGSVLDLTSIYHHKRNQWVEEFPPNGTFKGTSGGLAICISACKDDQNAYNEQMTYTGLKTAAGALTYSFIQAVKKNPRTTYAALVNSIQDGIEESSKTHGRKIIATL
ncbi:metacaspase-3-like [Rutidosis leptorrhynchoides]|uniref:metacaspase-3-like n=1 Tax=Rutidosis leptorrhynchoides TaxID=125765 RepID=UPI003A99EFA5